MRPARKPGAGLEQRVKTLKSWMAAGALGVFVLSWLFTSETTYEWSEPPPAGTQLVQLGGSLNRNLFQIRGLSLQLRYADGHRLSWIGPPEFAPAGLVHSSQGVHLVLVEWGRPLGEEGRDRRTLVCWVRDQGSGSGTVVTPLFVPQPLVGKLLPGFRRFQQVDAETVQRAPRMSVAEL